MTDILILCLPADEARAGAIVGGLQRNQVATARDVRFRAIDPSDSEWGNVQALAASAPCVLFCWSAATGSASTRAYRQLAATTLADGRAISVELDSGTVPVEMTGSSVYPLHDWHSVLGAARYFLFGQAYLTQIAAAASEKVIGRDPPPPSTFWRLVRWQAWVAMGGVAFLVGTGASVLQFYRDPVVARWLDPEVGAAFETAAKTRDCDTIRRFVASHPGSAWSDDAAELLATCKIHDHVMRRNVNQPLALYAANAAEAQVEAQRVCSRRADASTALLVSVAVTATGRSGDYDVVCTLDQPFTEPRETMGAPMPK